MADIGTPHPAPSLPNQFTGNDSRSGVGKPGNLGTDIGVPHFAPTLGSTFTGSDSRANVGQPSTGQQIGQPNP